MKVVYPRCAGIDIHKDKMTVCVFVDPGKGVEPVLERRTLATHSEGLTELEKWLLENAVTDVGLESTGVYWKPVWNALEGKVVLHLCNPEHVRAIPGQKTDRRDGKRLAELLAYGKLPESFIPPQWQRELRDLTRLRTQFTREVSRTASRVLKVLEDAQIKLKSVASEVLGVSARLMVEALARGETDERKLSEMAKGKLRQKRAELAKALKGSVREHHRLQLRILLDHLKESEERIFQLDLRIGRYLDEYPELVQRLDAVPGINRVGVAIILAEIGNNVAAWEDADKLAAWACVCPGNKISAGKRLSGKMRKGNPWLRGALCQFAWAATRTKGSYFRAQFRRLAGRRGRKRAAMAVAHSLLIVIYHLLRDPALHFHDLGEDYFDKRDAEHTAASLMRRLANLGYEVTLKPKAA